jgi:hypothetical protein
VLPLGGGPDGKSPIFVAGNTVVSYSVYAMHRRVDIYGPDAAEFRPERWKILRTGWEYLMLRALHERRIHIYHITD